MSLTEGFLIWIVSFLFLVLVMLIAYKISYKLGIKKALYRTTYILLSVIFAFVLAPVVNGYLFQIDLSRFNITLYYKEASFTALIDYVEEVIVHSEFLNDLYVHFPSLKDLLMDFPQILFVPIVYVFLFVLFLIIWLPLYLYLSYKRKRRILYEREDNKKHRIWAGVLGCVQVIFIVSAVLSPLNGLSRIYQNATKDTLDDESASLCDEHQALSKYEVYCEILEVYNSSVFATIGGNDSVSNMIFDSLTRISYDEGYTSLSKEASLIIKSGIVLNQSGLLDSVLVSENMSLLDAIETNNLTDEDIDIIVETLSESNYSQDLLVEITSMVENTLNQLMKQIFVKENFVIEYEIDTKDAINEIRVGLKTLVLLGNSSLLNDLLIVTDKIIEFNEEVAVNKMDEKVVFGLLLDIANSVDLDALSTAMSYLLESKIFKRSLPFILDRILSQFGFSFVATQGDYLTISNKAIDFFRILKKYQTNDPLDLVVRLEEEDLLVFADVLQYLMNTAETSGFVRFLLYEMLRWLDINYMPSDIINIKNWKKEIFVLQDFCEIVQRAMNGSGFEFNDVVRILSYKDSEFVDVVIKTAKSNSSFFLRELILMIGK